MAHEAQDDLRETAPKKHWIFPVVKFGLSITLLAWAGKQADWSFVSDGISGATLAAFVTVVAIQFSNALPLALRWWLILRAANHPMPFRTCLELTLIGKFFNQMLPTSVGGDAYRIWAVKCQGHSIGIATTGIVLDRLSALVAVAPLLIVGLLSADWLGSQHELRAGLWALALGIPIAAIVMVTAPGRLLRLSPRLHPYLETVSDFLRSGCSNPGVLIGTLALSVWIHLVAGWSIWALLNSFTPGIEMAPFLFLTAAVVFAMALPISVNGWGVRESAVIAIFAWGLGHAESPLVAASVGYGLAILISALPGVVVWLVKRPSNA